MVDSLLTLLLGSWLLYWLSCWFLGSSLFYLFFRWCSIYWRWCHSWSSLICKIVKVFKCISLPLIVPLETFFKVVIYKLLQTFMNFSHCLEPSLMGSIFIFDFWKIDSITPLIHHFLTIFIIWDVEPLENIVNVFKCSQVLLVFLSFGSTHSEYFIFLRFYLFADGTHVFATWFLASSHSLNNKLIISDSV